MTQINRASRPKRTVLRTINAATAAESVGPITPGIEVYGLSKGQFSLIELITHILDATGPAHVTISTWTAAGADLAHTHQLLADGRITTARWLVDFSFPSRQPAYCSQLRERFGDDSIRCTANHAKFVLIRNDSWSIAIRTSMNLNLNRRLESYEISDDAELCDWLETVIDDAYNGGASTIADARKSPSAAQRSINELSGLVAPTNNQPSFEANQHGISFD